MRVEADGVHLDDTALLNLTGYRLPSRQVQELKRLGIAHRVNRRGYPIVRISDYQSRSKNATAADWKPKLELVSA